MKLEFYRPQNEVLKKYMEGYYFITPDQDPQPITYWTFPNNYFIISINLGAHIEMGKNSIVVSHTAGDNVTADFVAHYSTPIEVVYEDAIPEITIYFKPSGINHFIEKAGLLVKQGNAIDFNPFPDFYPAMKQLLKMPDRSLQIEALEQYWLSKFVPKDQQVLESVLLDLESELSIAEIAAKHNFSRQHLNNLVVKGIGKSSSEYRKILRFRNAIRKKKDTKKLTELTYESLFYDQSHMIKDFKQLTKLSPNSFFKSIDIEKENIWLFI